MNLGSMKFSPDLVFLSAAQVHKYLRLSTYCQGSPHQLYDFVFTENFLETKLLLN